MIWPLVFESFVGFVDMSESLDLLSSPVQFALWAPPIHRFLSVLTKKSLDNDSYLEKYCYFLSTAKQGR